MRIYFILILLALSGCGYRFADNHALPGKPEQVYVNVFENQTMDTDLGHIITNDLIYELTRRTKVIITPQASTVLAGKITSIQTETIARQDASSSQERRVKVFINLNFKHAGKTIWSANDIHATETYLVMPEKVGTEYNRRMALKKLSPRLAENVFYRLTADF